MALPHELSLIIQRSHSLPEILESTVSLIAEELGTDVCSIYLVDPGEDKITLAATVGLDPSALGRVELKPGEGLTGVVVDEMRALAVDDASSHPGYLYFPETGEERFKSYLGVPLILRNRSVGAIVVQTVAARAHSQTDIESLVTIAAQLVGVVESARLIDALDRGEAGLRYLKEVRNWYQLDDSDAIDPHPVNLTIRGTAASPGIAMAQVVVRGSYDLTAEDYERSSLGEDKEKERLTDALEKTRQDILRIQKDAETQADEEHALIFSSHLLLLNDPVLLGMIEDSISKGHSAAIAVHTALDEFCDRLRAVKAPYIQDRVEDILDLRSRLLGYLLYSGARSSSVSDRVVISRGTPPSLVVELKAKDARALVTETGGATSHGALLARSMGIPAVSGISGISARVHADDYMIVDGDAGAIIINPSPEAVERYETKMRELGESRSQNAEFCSIPARTRDNHRVHLQANIGIAADLDLAKTNGAEGVGLYRTEFPFIIREQFPTRDEQVRIYKRAYDVFPEGNVKFRLLDLGGDKFVPGGEIVADRNPFHGYRSIRVLLDNPEILRNQVQAFALAAGKRPLSILIPMISSVAELQKTKALIRESLQQLPFDQAQTSPSIGVMIELPAAVEIARHLAKECDFFSIGTNDLIQYALAVDRENSRVASEQDSYHPAILRMILRTTDAAHDEDVPVTVCGELASDWRLAMLLTAMGVDSLSITPSAMLPLKRQLIRQDLETVKRRLDRLLSAPDAANVQEDLAELLPDA